MTIINYAVFALMLTGLKTEIPHPTLWGAACLLNLWWAAEYIAIAAKKKAEAPPRAEWWQYRYHGREIRWDRKGWHTVDKTSCHLTLPLCLGKATHPDVPEMRLFVAILGPLSVTVAFVAQP